MRSWLPVLLLVPCAAAQIVRNDNTPLRDACAEGSAEIVKLKFRTPVKIRFALEKDGQRCFAVTAEADGAIHKGFLWERELAGTDAFEQARRHAVATQINVGSKPVASKPLTARAGAGKSGISRRAAPVPRAPAPPQDLPDFSLKSLDDPLTLYDRETLLGKTYLIDFWAVWCGPCISEMPHLHDVYKKFRLRNFEILSVSLDRSPDDVKKFRQGRWRMPWLNAFAPGGFDSTAAKQFQVAALPSPILVDASGKVVARGDSLRGHNLERVLEQVLSLRP